MDSNLAVVKRCSIMELEPLRSTNQIQIQITLTNDYHDGPISHPIEFTPLIFNSQIETERMNEELLENIDSLWFFSSILRPSSQLLTQNPQISTKTNEYTHAQKQDQVGEQTTAAKNTSQKTKEDCNSNCIEIAGVEKRRGKRKGRNSKKRVQKWIQQSSAGTQWEDRTPFAVLYDCQMRNSRRNEQSGIDSKFTNDLEMKQQLRSWAYAVARSVRS